MAEYSPPTDNVPIFDVTNFAPSDTGLTEAQIASKFLRYPTGQGTETLPELITGTITAPNTMNIVMPNSSATNVLNVGVVSRNIAGQIHHYSDGDNCVAGAGVHLNNGNNNASSTNIMNGTTTTGICNIMSGASSTGTTNIGATTSTLALKGTTSILGATSINTSGGLNTVIGTTSLGSVSLKGLSVSIADSTNVNIQTTSISDNTKSTTIGTTNGAFSTLTTINGRLTTAGVTNINTSGTANTTIGNDTGGTTTLSNDTIIIGNADTLTTMNGANIKQVIKTFGGTLIENVFGNTTVTPSMSTTFNRKYITPVGSAVNCFTITSNTSAQFTSQYFEIVVSGCNAGRGSYTYKGCFGVEKIDSGNMTPSSVSTLFYFGTGISPPTTSVIPVIAFVSNQTVCNVTVDTSGGSSTDQNFITTIISFPTCSRRASAPQLEDFLIAAV